jgi:hypothetical protein
VRARALSVVCAAALAAVAVMARADGVGVVLHEYVPPDPNESLSLAAPGYAGASPTAIDTPSGAIAPPDLERTPPPESVYDRATDGASSSFRPDRDTRRPDHESYDDPFSPQLTPFKRMTAFDAVRDDYSLYVRDPSLQPLAINDGVAEGDDRFFGDLSVELRAGEAVRIPTVAASARALRLTTSPLAFVELLRDGADNWFLRGRSNERVRVVLDLVAPREGFEADYPDIPWRSLPVVPSQPRAHHAAFERVARAVGLSRQLRPREVVTKLTEYFRSFAPSDDPPPAGADVYLDLALSKKGVCRHRAFAFLVTALNAGIPARLVSNEAHAWVEVRDDRLWRRIDLGGAALDLQQNARLDRPQHVPPPDAFAWPTGRDSGADLGARERRDAEGRRAARQPTATDPTGNAAPSPTAANAGAESEPSATRADVPADGSEPSSTPLDGKLDARAPALVRVDDVDRDLFRGRPMRLRGHISASGEPCARVRVDVFIASSAAGERRVGSLATDERGNYDGEVGLPRDLTVGDYDLYVATPGNARCGAARSK